MLSEFLIVFLPFAPRFLRPATVDDSVSTRKFTRSFAFVPAQFGSEEPSEFQEARFRTDRSWRDKLSIKQEIDEGLNNT